MAVIVKTLVPPLQLANTQTTLYTATNVRATLDKVTVTNTDTVARTFSLNLVQSGLIASNSNLLVDDKTVQPNETYTCPEVVGHSLDNGAFISVIASAASALTLRISGREYS